MAGVLTGNWNNGAGFGGLRMFGILGMVAVGLAMGIGLTHFCLANPFSASRKLMFRAPLVLEGQNEGTTNRLDFVLPRGQYVLSYWLALPEEMPVFEPFGVTFSCALYVGDGDQALYEHKDTFLVSTESIGERHAVLDHSLVRAAEARQVYFPFLASRVECSGADNYAPWWLWDSPVDLDENVTRGYVLVRTAGVEKCPSQLRKWHFCIENDSREAITSEMGYTRWTKPWLPGENPRSKQWKEKEYKGEE